MTQHVVFAAHNTAECNIQMQVARQQRKQQSRREQRGRFSRNVVLIKHQLGFFVAASKGADGGKLFKRRSRTECDPVS
jgi:hypothetical protein